MLGRGTKIYFFLHPVTYSLCQKETLNNCILNEWKLCKRSRCYRNYLLTLHKGSKEHSEPAQPAPFVGPHSDHSHSCLKHYVIGHRAAKLGLEIFNRTASIIDRDEVSLAFIGVLHLIIQEPQINLQQGNQEKHCFKKDTLTWIHRIPYPVTCRLNSDSW